MFHLKIFFFLIFFFVTTNSFSKEFKIIFKVNKEIITNIDFANEKKYLKLLNVNIEKIKEKELEKLAEESLIREKIKKEKLKVFLSDLDINKFENTLVKNFYKKRGFDDLIKFKNYINFLNLNYDYVKNKIIIDALWSNFIIETFSKNISINEEKIKKRILEQYKNSEKRYQYNLSEIFITYEEFNQETEKNIYKNINEFGFEFAANKFSKSESFNNGGKIGWIDEIKLNNTIKDKIKKINSGGLSDPIDLKNGILILKINDKREIKEKLDLNKDLKLALEFEKKRQLSILSLNYFKKLKQNTIIEKIEN